MNCRIQRLLRVAVLTCSISAARAEVVINEFVYDDTGTDDREFVELFNNGLIPVDIGLWTVMGRDQGATANPSASIPFGIILQPGAYYVIGNAGVPNLNQTVAANFLENDIETIELYNESSVLIDALLYEGRQNLTIAFPPGVASQIGNAWGFFGDHTSTDTTAGRTFTTVARHLDGRDTNNNGRDFGLRPSTPGTSNQGAGVISSYGAPNVDALGDATVVSGLSGSFVNARVITPTVTTAGLNPNSIPAPLGFNKAIIAWDQSGGGNGTVADAPFDNGGSFAIQAYFDTTNLPLSVNATAVTFRGSEQTFYGIGSVDAPMNLADLSGAVTLAPASLGTNGATGIHWYYEKVGETANGLGDVSEKLYLIDANDGGPNNADYTGGLDWTILATVDLSTKLSGWYTLSLSIAPDGSGSATFDDQTFTFNTVPGLVGEFAVGYRENTQANTITVPDYLRPATFAQVPEPVTGVLCAFGVLGFAGRRRRARR